jgi:hypothetical protein
MRKSPFAVSLPLYWHFRKPQEKRDFEEFLWFLGNTNVAGKRAKVGEPVGRPTNLSIGGFPVPRQPVTVPPVNPDS